MKELRVLYQRRGQSLWLGTLADDGADIIFQYSSEALAAGVELSPLRLPLRAHAYPDHQRDYLDLMRVPGLLFDSLPDGWGMVLMERRLRAKGIDIAGLSVLDRLAYLGANTMGALTYEPADPANIAGRDLSIVELAAEMRELLADDSHAVLAELARVGGSPGGARPKAVTYFNAGTGAMSTHAHRVAGAAPWLFKFPAKEDASDSCALEEVYARMARRCGLGMEPTTFIAMADGLSAFGSRRFDRTDNGERVHVHSLSSLLHANFRLPSLGYTELLQATRRLTSDQREVTKALQRCVFNVVMNNRDDHAKNFSFMLDADHHWTLAPPYDLTWAPGNRGEHFMDVAGEGKAPRREHVLTVARAGGLKAADAAIVIDSMLDQLTAAALREEAAGLPVRPATIKAVIATIDANRSRIKA